MNLETLESQIVDVLSSTPINPEQGKAIGLMSTEEIIQEFKVACEQNLEITREFIIVYVNLKNPEALEIIQENYPEYFL